MIDSQEQVLPLEFYQTNTRDKYSPRERELTEGITVSAHIFGRDPLAISGCPEARNQVTMDYPFSLTEQPVYDIAQATHSNWAYLLVQKDLNGNERLSIFTERGHKPNGNGSAGVGNDFENSLASYRSKHPIIASARFDGGAPSGVELSFSMKDYCLENQIDLLNHFGLLDQTESGFIPNGIWLNDIDFNHKWMSILEKFGEQDIATTKRKTLYSLTLSASEIASQAKKSVAFILDEKFKEINRDELRQVLAAPPDGYGIKVVHLGEHQVPTRGQQDLLIIYAPLDNPRSSRFQIYHQKVPIVVDGDSKI